MHPYSINRSILHHAVQCMMTVVVCFSMATVTLAEPAAEIDRKVDALLKQMTLEEKTGQMCQFVGLEHLKSNLKNSRKVASNDDATGMYPNLTFHDLEQMVRDGKIGSFLHVVTAKEANYLQTLAMQSRLKIPLIIGIDAIHGDALVRGTTVYPSPLGLAATFDEALVEKLSAETASEIRVNGAQWTFTPPGLFQLMPDTARAQGLSLFPFDTRTDPSKSAHASAKLLRGLHARFDSWPLALAAYNAGEGRVGRTLKKQNATTFAEIAESLPAETRLYVPKVLATLKVREGIAPGALADPVKQPVAN